VNRLTENTYRVSPGCEAGGGPGTSGASGFQAGGGRPLEFGGAGVRSSRLEVPRIWGRWGLGAFEARNGSFRQVG
jgi:hypothetical protein